MRRKYRSNIFVAKEVYPFPIFISKELDKRIPSYFLEHFFDDVINAFDATSINTGKVEKLAQHALIDGRKVFEYNPYTEQIDSQGKRYSKIYYKIARDEQEIRDQYMVAIHINS